MSDASEHTATSDTAGNQQPGDPSKAYAGEDDRLLIERVRGGETECFNELVNRHGDRLYQMLLQLARGDHEFAGELVQEAFVRAYERLDRFNGESSFATWLYRLARNRAIDVMAKKRPQALGGEVLEATADQYRPLADDPSAQVVSSETAAAVHAALAELNVEQRELILMRDFQDLDYAEIAARLDVPVGTIKSRLSRARAALRTLVSERLPEGWP